MNFRKFLNNRKIKLGIVVLFLTISAFLALYYQKNEVMPQASIYFLDDAKLPERNNKVLIFSPHPDDETIGVGGYIIESIKKGADVRIVLVTDGNKHGLKSKRYEEFKKATSILGVPISNLVFLNYPDGSLKKEDQNTLSSDFTNQIDNYHPDFILYPDPNDQHPDHSITGKVVEQVLSNEKPENLQTYKYLIHHSHFPQPKKLKKDLYLLPPVKLIRFDEEWQRFLLNNDEENQKQKAILSYKSQLRVPFLRSLILSFIRKNELLSVSSQIIKQ